MAPNCRRKASRASRVGRPCPGGAGVAQASLAPYSRSLSLNTPTLSQNAFRVPRISFSRSRQAARRVFRLVSRSHSSWLSAAFPGSRSGHSVSNHQPRNHTIFITYRWADVVHVAQFKRLVRHMNPGSLADVDTGLRRSPSRGDPRSSNRPRPSWVVAPPIAAAVAPSALMDRIRRQHTHSHPILLPLVYGYAVDNFPAGSLPREQGV
jgi:hypothetical protein